MNPHKIDVTGKRFGRLTALSPTPKRNTSGHVVWKCQCDCGNITYVAAACLRHKTKPTRSCGCLQREHTRSLGQSFWKDITGQRFGRLIALMPIPERLDTNIVWECQCDCGDIINVRGQCLRNGTTKSCGCLARELTSQLKRKDITGHRSGKLVALEPTSKRVNGHIVWKCLCDCGKSVNVGITNFNNGTTKSCGCLRKGINVKDITGRRYGRLIVLESTSKRYERTVIWKCLCDCGNVVFVNTGALQTGNKKSCGCLADAMLWSRYTEINPMDVPFEITNLVKARREVEKAIKQAV